MQFQYRIANNQGQIEQGRIEADSKDQLLAKFKSQGKFPLEIKEVAATPLRLGRGGLKAQDRLNFTQQLAGLLKAGIPLERGLGILCKLKMGRELDFIVQQLRRLLQEGHSFTAALERFPTHFPPLFTNMVRAGEAGGVLPEVLRRLALYQEDEIKLKRHITSSLIYPCAVLAFSIAAVFFFVIVVIPSFEQIFTDMGTELPLITKVILMFGQGVIQYWWVLTIFVVLAMVWFIREQSTTEGRVRLDRLKLNLPIIGGFLKRVATARLAMALSLLHGSGVSLLTSLGITSEVVGNRVLGRALKEVEQRVQQGNTLAQSMLAQKVFPVLAVEMIGIGEESGSLETMLEQVAKTYDDEVKHSLSLFLAVFEPTMIMVLVGVIAILAMAILVPIININSQIG